MSALKAGTVCYITRCPRDPRLVGRVVTLTGEITGASNGVLCYVHTAVRSGPSGDIFWASARDRLRPINDPDQPVDVTSDTDEPVTA